MSDLYKGKYRVDSTRLQNWDYGWRAAYFITICTYDHHCYFGQIKNSKSQLSPIGIIADILWHEIKHHAKNVELGEFVVMPNHIHGILILKKNNKTRNDPNPNDKRNHTVETRHALSLPSGSTKSSDETVKSESSNESLQSGSTKSSDETVKSDPPSDKKTIGQKRFQNQGKNTVSSIMGGYKSAVTKHARRLGFEFGWQARFYDRIIQDKNAYHRIAQYIINNPKKWKDDRFYK